MFDDCDDYLPIELVAIVNHWIASNMLELEVEYSDGTTSWHLIDVIKLDDPQSVANYVMKNDFSPRLNNTHGRWARAFLRSLKRTMRRLR